MPDIWISLSNIFIVMGSKCCAVETDQSTIAVGNALKYKGRVTILPLYAIVNSCGAGAPLNVNYIH